MIRTISLLIVLFLFINPYTDAQEWLQEIINELNTEEKGLPEPDDLMGNLLAAMNKSIGESSHNIVFKNFEDGRLDSLSNYIGKVVLVNLWSTHCSGCRWQLPHLSRLQEEYSNYNLMVIYASPEDSLTLKAYFDENNTTGYKAIVKGDYLKRPFQLLAFPSAYLIDSEGIIQEIWIRPEEFEDLEKRVSPYLTKYD